MSCIVTVMWYYLLWLHIAQHAVIFHFCHTIEETLKWQLASQTHLVKFLKELPPYCAIYCQQQRNAGVPSALPGPWYHQCCCYWYSGHKEIPVQRIQIHEEIRVHFTVNTMTIYYKYILHCENPTHFTKRYISVNHSTKRYPLQLFK